MGYIKKAELKNLLLDKLRTEYEDIGFKLVRGKGRFYKYIEGGLLMFDCKVNDAYNFEKDEVAWRIEMSFFIGFEAVHKWFEVFEHRNKKDYKYYWTYGNDLDNIAGKKFLIDVDASDVNDFLVIVTKAISNSFSEFYETNRNLHNLNKNNIPSSINTIEDVNNISSFNFRTAIEFLTIAWILKREDFNQMLELFKERIEELVSVGDPMARDYYPRFNEIIEALKSTDFSNAILCLENDANRKSL